jgi:hypothetical protein
MIVAVRALLELVAGLLASQQDDTEHGLRQSVVKNARCVSG